MTCEEAGCYEAAIISIRKDLFGKSDAMRHLCSHHAPRWLAISGQVNEKAIGGSDVCHTCAAHVKVITEDLEPRIRALEAELADSRLIAREQEDAHVAANMRYSAELALRQTAEACAARNALRVIALWDQAQQIQEARMVWAMGCDCLCNHCKGFDKLILSFPPITNTVRPTELETACTCDSTLVTDTSNHQPHCPRYVAETACEHRIEKMVTTNAGTVHVCEQCSDTRFVSYETARISETKGDVSAEG